MPIDLLPFSAFALESSGAPADAVSETNTLTLRLAPLPLLSAFPSAMSGTIRVQAAATDAEAAFRASVVQANGSDLTLTF